MLFRSSGCGLPGRGDVGAETAHVPKLNVEAGDRLQITRDTQSADLDGNEAGLGNDGLDRLDCALVVAGDEDSGGLVANLTARLQDRGKDRIERLDHRGLGSELLDFLAGAG